MHVMTGSAGSVGRRSIAVALVAAVAVGGGLLAWQLRPAPAPSDSSARPFPSYAEDQPRARTLARQACAVLDKFVAEVQSDQTAEDAQRTLDRFETTALTAYSHDVRWVRLLTSAKALQAALRDDDAEAARLGLLTAEEECAKARSDG